MFTTRHGVSTVSLSGLRNVLKMSVDAPDALLHTQFVSRFRHCTDTLACGAEDVRVVVFLEGVELLLAHPFGHKLLPRARVYFLGEVFNGDFFVLTLQLSTIDEQRHTDGYATEDGNGRLAVLRLLFQFFKPALLFLGQFLLGFLLQLLLLLVFLARQPWLLMST